jgi:hypothetical protein
MFGHATQLADACAMACILVQKKGYRRDLLLLLLLKKDAFKTLRRKGGDI